MGDPRAVRALRLVSVALIIVGFLSAAVVGGSTKKAGAQQVATVTAAPDSVAAAGTVVIKFHFHAAANGKDVNFDGVEHQDFANHRSTGQITLPQPLGDLNLVADGNTVYFQTKNTTGASGEPGWFRIDIAEGVFPSASDQSVAGVPNGFDYLAYLRHLSGDVTDEGNTKIDGIAVHHYRAKLDLGKLIGDNALDSQQAQLRQLEQQGVHFETSMDAFIDDNGLPRRVTMKISAQGFSFDIRLDFVDYGSSVDVVAPPADQVVETRTVSSKAEFVAVSQELGRRLVSGG